MERNKERNKEPILKLNKEAMDEHKIQFEAHKEYCGDISSRQLQWPECQIHVAPLWTLILELT